MYSTNFRIVEQQLKENTTAHQSGEIIDKKLENLPYWFEKDKCRCKSLASLLCISIMICYTKISPYNFHFFLFPYLIKYFVFFLIESIRRSSSLEDASILWNYSLCLFLSLLFLLQKINQVSYCFTTRIKRINY